MSGGVESCVAATGTLTLTEFSPTAGVTAGSYSLVVDSPAMSLSDVFSGVICAEPACQ
jgi:hypothetical protein